MRNNKKVLKKRKNALSFPEFQEKYSTEKLAVIICFRKDGRMVLSVQNVTIPAIMNLKIKFIINVPSVKDKHQ